MDEKSIDDLMADQYKPTLTLEPEIESNDDLVAQPTAPPVAEAKHSLTKEEQQMVDQFTAQIDLNNSNMILQYGSAAQKKIATFSESALNNIQTKDLGEIGDMLTGLVNELRGFNTEEDEKGLKGFFKKSTNKIATMKTKYDKAEVNVGKICQVLEKHQVQLFKDIALLDKMYQLNLTYFKELSMYIAAGQQKLQEVREVTLPQLVALANQSGDEQDVQKANDTAALCDRFEKKIHDLQLTKMVALQMGPQIRMVQNNDTLMAEKIQSTIVNTIPLWKSQMVLALGVAHSSQAISAQQQVDDMTNELLKRNAKSLKINTVETAKAAQRGIVDMETLKYTNDMLISTIDEVIKIQKEGRQKRQEAQAELGKLEESMKEKLLSSC